MHRTTDRPPDRSLAHHGDGAGTIVDPAFTIVDTSLTVARAALTRERIAALPEDDWPLDAIGAGAAKAGAAFASAFSRSLN